MGRGYLESIDPGRRSGRRCRRKSTYCLVCLCAAKSCDIVKATNRGRNVQGGVCPLPVSLEQGAGNSANGERPDATNDFVRGAGGQAGEP